MRGPGSNSRRSGLTSGVKVCAHDGCSRWHSSWHSSWLSSKQEVVKENQDGAQARP